MTRCRYRPHPRGRRRDGGRGQLQDEPEVKEGSSPPTRRTPTTGTRGRRHRLCPRFVSRWVSRVRVGPSPDAVRMRLLAAGQRPIDNVVDASNYVMMIELGKPMPFDAAAVTRAARTAACRRPAGEAEAERLRDPRPRCSTTSRRTTCSSPADGPIGLAGVMGGARVGGERVDARRRGGVSHLRPCLHPAYRPASRSPFRGVEPLREGPGGAPGPYRDRPDGAAPR